MVEEVEQCLEFLTVLKTDYVRVATKTNALHEACENLLEDQVGLLSSYQGSCVINFVTARLIMLVTRQSQF